MSERSGLPPDEPGSTVLFRPADDGGLRPATGDGGDYRDGLRSRRWDAAPLLNPEAQKTDPRIAVLAIAILSAITLLVLVAGYASGFWALPS